MRLGPWAVLGGSCFLGILNVIAWKSQVASIFFHGSFWMMMNRLTHILKKNGETRKINLKLGGRFKHFFFLPRSLRKSSNLTCAYFSNSWEKNHQLVILRPRKSCAWEPTDSSMLNSYLFEKMGETRKINPKTRWWQLKHFWNFYPDPWGNHPI